MTLRLELYTPDPVSAGILEVPIEPDGAMEIARRSRGTPRIANRMLRRVRDFAQVKADGVITTALEVDQAGPGAVDRMAIISPLWRPGGIPDEVLCARAASGDRAAEETLVLRYSRLVRVVSRPFFLAGGDSEDLIQEGMLGLLSAIREFRPDRGARFRTFAEVCVRRRIISVVRAAAGGKHTPLNDSVSLDPSLVLANQDFTSFGTAYHQQRNPEDVVIHEENLSALEEAIQKELTGLEAQVLALYLSGLSYAEIAEEVRRSTKSVDNAVQRVRRKIAQYLSRGEYSES